MLTTCQNAWAPIKFYGIPQESTTIFEFPGLYFRFGDNVYSKKGEIERIKHVIFYNILLLLVESQRHLFELLKTCQELIFSFSHQAPVHLVLKLYLILIILKTPFYEIPTQIWQELTRDQNNISFAINNGNESLFP